MTPHTRRHTETRNANNILINSSQRRRRRPTTAASIAAPSPSSSPSSHLSIKRLSTDRYLLTHQSLHSLINIAHSLSLMNVVYSSFHLSFLTIISCSHCNVFHWKEEGVHGSTRENPIFAMCCSKGAVML